MPDVLSSYVTNYSKQRFAGSTFYLGAALSSWTQTVLTDRLARGVKRHDSVLHVVGKGKLN